MVISVQVMTIRPDGIGSCRMSCQYMKYIAEDREDCGAQLNDTKEEKKFDESF